MLSAGERAAAGSPLTSTPGSGSKELLSFLQGADPSLLHHGLVEQTRAHQPVCRGSSPGQRALGCSVLWWLVWMSAAGKAEVPRKLHFRSALPLSNSQSLPSAHRAEGKQQQSPNTPNTDCTQAMGAVAVPHNVTWSLAWADRGLRTLLEVLTHFLPWRRSFQTAIHRTSC